MPRERNLDPTPVSARLRLALDRQERTPYWLARQVGASPQAVLDVLAGADPRASRLAAFADALDVSTDWLLGRDTRKMEESETSS